MGGSKVGKRKKSLVGYGLRDWNKTFRKNHPNWPNRIFVGMFLCKKHPLANIKVRITIKEI